MAKLTSPDGSYVLTRPRSIFPVTRQLSYPLTHILYYLPISPNQITMLSMAAGLAGDALGVSFLPRSRGVTVALRR